MPFPVSKKIAVIKEVLDKKRSVSDVCREYNISRKTFYQWKSIYLNTPNRSKKKALEPHYLKGKHHPKNKRSQYYFKIIPIVANYPSWGSQLIANQINRKGFIISRHAINNLLKDYNLETEEKRSLFSLNYQKLKSIEADGKRHALRLTPLLRKQIIEAVVIEGRPIADICRKFNISRKTFYQWFRRYQQAKEARQKLIKSMRDGYVRGLAHPRSVSGVIQDQVINLVKQHPEYSSHKIAQTLANIGNHGVQNLLQRFNLNTYERRLAYAQTYAPAAITTPTYGFPEKAKQIIGSLPVVSAIPPPLRFVTSFLTQGKLLLRPLLTSFLTTFILSNIIFYWIRILVQAPTLADKVGLVFATISLLIGGLFFIYSMKYYLTLALVLSFSRNPKENGHNGFTLNLNGKVNGNSQNHNGNGTGNLIGWIAKLLGIRTPISADTKLINADTGSSAGGLQPSLDHIHPGRYPFFSIHLPFYNEKKVAERIIRACMGMDYPGAYEVIICDDSNDETVQIIRGLMKSLGPIKEYQTDEGDVIWQVDPINKPTLKVLHRATRSGFKGGALSHALNAIDSRTEFVCVFDADFIPYPDTLEQFLKYFKVTGGWSEEKDYRAAGIQTVTYSTFSLPRSSEGSGEMGNGKWEEESEINHQLEAIRQKANIACVAGYQWHVLNKSENWITRGVRTEYAGSYVVERPGQEILGAMKIIHGSVYCIRADVLKHFGWGTSITEDYELTLRIYEKGFKVVFTPYIQAPSECVSTLKRFIRQRMRWAEGHSFNTRKMLGRLLFNPKLTLPEKLEFLYLAPYYLQATFFILGTLSWLLSETVFKVRLPFWTALWGWSLVLTNFFSLPLVNAVGLFLEESEEKDYVGLFSFILLCYILTPFQAYAAVKGFIRKTEGPWFRTPKTGKVTDIFTRGSFYRWLTGLIPGKKTKLAPAFSTHQSTINPLPTNHFSSPYLALATANSRFTNFSVRPRQMKWLGKTVLVTLLIICQLLFTALPGIDFLPSQKIQASGFGMLKNNPSQLSKTAPVDLTSVQSPTVDQNTNFDPAWGVLAINTNKSIYQPGETVRLAMAVLNEQGKMDCEANLELRIKNYELEINELLSIENGGIKVNPECQVYDLVERPDFEAEYQAGKQGNYELELTAETKNGHRTIKDNFEVSKTQLFDIERDINTRLYPVKTYQARIVVKAKEDFRGEVIERISDTFEVRSTKSEVRSDNNEKQLVWSVDWKKGETYELTYEFKTPEISPEYYLLGPLEFKSMNNESRIIEIKFQESRAWQLAVDVPSEYSKYTEKYENWTEITTTGWSDQSLSGSPYSVPASAVCEIAIGNSTSNAKRTVGVRTNGSTINRYFTLDEAEAGGEDYVVMHVQVDASSVLENYVDVASNVTFYLLGYWASGTYVEKMETLGAASADTWEDENLSGYGVGANNVVEVVTTNSNSTYTYSAGVRANGSSLDRRVTLRALENSGGVDTMTLLAKADASSIIEIYEDDTTAITPYLVGYWSVAPGNYIERFESLSPPNADTTWLDINTDLVIDKSSKISSFWNSISPIFDLAFDSNDIKIYLSGTGEFAVYDPASDTATDKITKISDLGWTGTLYSMAYDSTNSKLYIGNNGGKFAVYDPATDTATDKTSKISSFWSTDWVWTLTFDSTNTKIYLGGGYFSVPSAKFAVYDPATDTATDLTSKISSFWSTNCIRDLTFDSTNSKVYLIGLGGKFAVYDPATDTATDKTSKISSFWSTDNGEALTFDSTNTRIYLGGINNFAVYDPSGDTATDKSSLFPFWTGLDIDTLEFDFYKSEVYVGMSMNYLAAYNPSSDTATDKTAKISPYTLSNIYGLAFDSTNNRLYIGGYNTDFLQMGFVPDYSVAEVLFTNGETAAENQMGARTNGSALGRLLDVQEAEKGTNGRDTGRLHAVADSYQTEVYHEDVSENVYEIRIVGYWTVYPLTGWSFQRKTFYDSTDAVFWRLYFNESTANTAIDYNTDPNGSSWTAATSIGAYTNDFSVWEDGTYVYLAFIDTYDVRVRRGTLNSSSITWGKAYTALNGSSLTNQYRYAYISRDSSGYLWVVAQYTDGTNYYLKAIRSDSANSVASWTGTVHSISSTTSTNSNTYGVIMPNASQDMYAIWIRGTAIEGRQWDNDAAGDQWDPDKTSNPDAIATGKSGLANNISAAADTSNNVHLTYIDNSNYVQYMSCSASCSGTFSSATRLDTSATNEYVTISIDSNNNDLYVIYLRSSVAYYKKYSSGWGSETDTNWTEGTSPTNLTSNYSEPGSIFAEWTSGSSSPYTLNWDDIILIPENLWPGIMMGLVGLRWIKRRRSVKHESRIMKNESKSMNYE